MPIKDVATEEEIFDEEPVKIKVRSKIKGQAQKFVLQEDDGSDDEDVEHSGVTLEDGTKLFDESPVEGGRILETNARTGKQAYVNAKGQKIDSETGEVLNPKQYQNDVTLGE